MPSTEGRTGIFQRLDRLNEFERQPVRDDKLHGGAYFAGSFAGEHVAATEFVIGALFVAGGASTRDVIVGLLLGNLLAVLSWALVCAPIAVKTRLTLYWYLRKIGGPVVMVAYNVLNALLYCVLAGCMITVAASAVRIPFGIEPQTGWLPTDPWFVAVTIGVGTLVVVLAILGFKRLAQFASVCSPWMLVMFLAGALVLWPKVGPVGSPAAMWHTAQSRIWTGPPPYQSTSVLKPEENGAEGPASIVLHFAAAEQLLVDGEGPLAGFSISGKGPGERRFRPADARIEGHTVVVSSPGVTDPAVVSYGEGEAAGNLAIADLGEPGTRVLVPPFRSYVSDAADVLTFWHIVAFAWICNLAMHLGLSDMALLRYARRSSYGLYSAFGMYLGHYVAWICAGVMGAAVADTLVMNTPLTLLDSGEVAFRALGAVGALAVVVAGWTTSNPTLYRAGLALQVVTPGWPRWLVTLIAGAVTTAIACFPFVFRELLGFVGLYGLLLMPVGAVVVTEHWIFPRIGLARFWSARRGQLVNWPAVVSWAIPLAAAFYCWYAEVVHLFFLAAPVWVLTTILYIVFAAIAGAAGRMPELPQEEATAAPPSAETPPRASARGLHRYFGGLALAALLSVVLISFCVFAGFLDRDAVLLWIGGLGLDFRGYLIAATVVYFVGGVIWVRGRERGKAGVD
ncbi:MAG: hypothetical protein ACYTG0_26895 [Planctomycetota bacterium]|jgi:purine-cytosine permease-like protein